MSIHYHLKEKMMTQDQLKTLKDKIANIKSSFKVQQITISRVVKTKNGDTFISMNATYGSKEDTENVDGLSLTDSKIASHLLGYEVNLLAHEQACASSLISVSDLEIVKKHLKSNFETLIKTER